ncbi:hypothetical protein [Ruminococcus sp. XPD3002]|uniref:hypothetical protein n=1 Tax=Ruminococcus sp. XPD3002 TaxID=1452269 RepID=UPI000913E16E|nr:hypothetical protein SAMN04487832_11636 [Ruminococcus flavefaciens]
MKNPMIENNINAELFEAIDENAVNGGLSIIGIHTTIQPISSALLPIKSVKILCLTVMPRTSIKLGCAVIA